MSHDNKDKATYVQGGKSATADAYFNRKKKEVANKMGNKYTQHLNPKRLEHSRDYDEVKKMKPSGSISWKHLRNKTPTVEHADDVRSARTRLMAAKIKHKKAFVESSTHKKGEWMVHYK